MLNTGVKRLLLPNYLCPDTAVRVKHQLGMVATPCKGAKRRLRKEYHARGRRRRYVLPALSNVDVHTTHTTRRAHLTSGHCVGGPSLEGYLFAQTMYPKAARRRRGAQLALDNIKHWCGVDYLANLLRAWRCGFMFCYCCGGRGSVRFL